MEQLLDYRLDIAKNSRWEIVSASAVAKQHLLYLQEAGLFYAGPGYYTTREGLDSYLVKLTLSGCGTLTYGGKNYLMRPGDFFWINCQQPQDYRTAQNTDQWHVLWCHFYGINAADYYTLFSLLNNGSAVGHLPPNSQIPQLIERLLQLYEERPGDLGADILCASHLTDLLSGLLEAVFVNQATPAVPPTVSAVRDYITEHYNQQVTLDTLAQRFNISKYHLQRTFRRFTGLSPNEYRQRIRLTRAKELLQTTDHPVSLIADAVGFESTSYFISAFKAQEGITPLKYRLAWARKLTS